MPQKQFRRIESYSTFANLKNILKTNELNSLLYITDIGFYPKANGHCRIRKGWAAQNILIYCTDGKGWVSTNGTKQELKKRVLHNRTRNSVTP